MNLVNGVMCPRIVTEYIFDLDLEFDPICLKALVRMGNISRMSAISTSTYMSRIMNVKEVFRAPIVSLVDMLSLNASEPQIVDNLRKLNLVVFLLNSMNNQLGFAIVQILNRLVWMHKSFIHDLLVPTRMFVLIRKMYESSNDCNLKSGLASLFAVVARSDGIGRQVLHNTIENGIEILQCHCRLRDNIPTETLILLSILAFHKPVQIRLHSYVVFMEVIINSLSVEGIWEEIFFFLSRKNVQEVSENCVRAYCHFRILASCLPNIYAASAYVRSMVPSLAELLISSIPLTNVFHYISQANKYTPFQVDLFLAAIDFLKILLGVHIEAANEAFGKVTLFELQTRCSKFWALVDSRHGSHVLWKPRVVEAVGSMIRLVGSIYPDAVRRCSGLYTQQS
jgi:hypothetical protein